MGQYFSFVGEVLVYVWRNKELRYKAMAAFLILALGILTNVLVPFAFKNLIESILSGNISYINLILLGYGGFWTFSRFSTHLREKLMHPIVERISYFLSLKTLQHLFQISLKYHLMQPTGSLSNIIRRTQRDIPTILWGIIFHIAPVFIEIIVVAVILFSLYPLFYDFIIIMILATFAIYTIISTQKTLDSRRIANEIDKKADSIIVDWILNYEIVKTFGLEKRAAEVCSDVLSNREKTQVHSLLISENIRIVQALILGVGLTILTFFLTRGIIAHELTVGDFVLFNSYFLQFIVPISFLGYIFRDVGRSLVDVRNIFDVLLIPSDIMDKAQSQTLEGDRFSIEFKNVTFHYEDHPILKDVSFKIYPGEKIAIVGTTGAGKSTTIKLLFRLYDVTSGQILINGVDIRDIKLEALYQILGLVPQEIVLFNDTIRSNIMLVRPGASQEEILQAIQSAGLVDCLNGLPEGIDTIVGERGAKLSGGEKQRIAIARLLIHRPSVYILDEPTSFLDVRTAASIQENIRQIAHDKTIITVTHDPAVIKNVDRIITLNQGKIHFDAPDVLLHQTQKII